MENETQNQNPAVQVPPNSQYEIPDTSRFPWLKYAEIAFVILAILNLGLFSFFLLTRPKPLSDELVGTEDEKGFLLTKPDQTISREGYSITFSNPRYEHLEGQSAFRADVELTNEAFQPTINVLANCDIEEGGQIVKTGVGVSVESGESKPVSPGESTSWTAMVVLENKGQRVASCLYAPEGVFDPKQTVRVVF